MPDARVQAAMRPDYELAVGAMLDPLGGGRDDVDVGRAGAAGVSLGDGMAERPARAA